jgi:peroxiredoxin
MPDSTLFYVSYIALWILVVFQTLILLELVRRSGSTRASSEAEGPTGEKTDFLEGGSPAPIFEAPDVASGKLFNSRELLGQRALLVFISPGCGTCESVASELVEFSAKSSMRMLALCSGPEAQCAQFVQQHLPAIQALVDRDGGISNQFGIKRVPTAVQIDADGNVLQYGIPRPATRLDLAEWVGAKDAQPDASNGSKSTERHSA